MFVSSAKCGSPGRIQATSICNFQAEGRQTIRQDEIVKCQLFRLVGVFATASVIAPIADAQWTLIRLHPAGAYESIAYDIDHGQTVGYAIINGTHEASIWMGSAASRISLHPGGGNGSIAYGVDNGRQVGMYNRHAAFWQGTASSYVHLGPNDAIDSQAVSISGDQKSGWIRPAGMNVHHAALWDGPSNTFADLHPPGFESSEASGVHNGVQYGYVYNRTIFGRAAAWRGTTAWEDLTPTTGTNPPQAQVFRAREGILVGVANTDQIPKACLWTQDSPGSWMNVNPGTQSNANDVRAGLVVGAAVTGGQHDWHAFIWNDAGVMATEVDLHQFVPADCDLSEAYGVDADANGTYVVGRIRLRDQTHFNGFREEAVMWVGPPPASDPFTFTVNKAIVAGQNYIGGTISVPAAKSVSTVYWGSSDTPFLSVPPRITLASGATTRSFQIRTQPVSVAGSALIKVQRGSEVHSKVVVLTPLVPSAMAFTPNPVTGGQTVNGRLVINGVAPSGGLTMTVADDSAFASTPAQVTVPAGAAECSFAITTTPVVANQTVRVTVAGANGSASGTFRIRP